MAGQPMLRVITIHAYPFGCVRDPRSSAYPTVGGLLRSSASDVGFGQPPAVQPQIAVAHGHHLAFRVDEINSASCGGLRGVSNTFASALWALDALFGLAADGVDGVNFHTRSFTQNKLFALREQRGRWVASVSPEYYGIELFARAAPPGARLLRTVCQAGIRCRATLGRDGRLRVVLINDSLLRAPRTVVVRVPGRAGSAVLERLQAPSVYATGGVTLAGQSFGSVTTTGTLAGPLHVSSVAPSGHGYRVMLPAASAAMLTVPAG